MIVNSEKKKRLNLFANNELTTGGGNDAYSRNRDAHYLSNE